MTEKKLYIFDFDDTLVRSSAQYILMKDNKPVRTLTESERGTLKLNQGESLNFDQFEDLAYLRDVELLDSYYRLLRFYNLGSDFLILTSRATRDVLISFFHNRGIELLPEQVICINSPDSGLSGSNSERKQSVLRSILKSENLQNSFQTKSTIDAALNRTQSEQKNQTENQSYSEVEIWDDSDANLNALKELEHEFNVHIITHNTSEDA